MSNLQDHHKPGFKMLGKFWTVANMLSIARLILVIPITYLILTDGSIAWLMGLIVVAVGTDWFDELHAQSNRRHWPFGDVEIGLGLEAVDRRVVVNAGAASRGLERVPPFISLRSTMNVLYDNTVRPRIEALTREANRNVRASIVIDIRESPYHMARRLGRLSSANFPEDQVEQATACAKRADALLAELSQHPESYWVEFANQTSKTPTKLTRAGVDEGARMMLHGYLSCLVAFHVIEDVALPRRLLGPGDFLDLAGRKRKTTDPDRKPGANAPAENGAEA